MRFLRCFMTDLKRMVVNPYFAVGVIALTLMYFSSSCYIDIITGREYSVFETFLKYRTADNYTVSAQYITTGLNGVWVNMFLVIISAFPFVNVICDEHKSGAKRYYIQRTGILRYSVSKIISSLISTALLCLTAYLLFTAAVYVMFPSMNSMSESQQEAYYMPYSYIKVLLTKVLEGVGASITTLMITAFVHNKYFCLCIPFFINYLRGNIYGKIVLNSFSSGKTEIPLYAQLISSNSITNIIYSDKKLPYIVFYGILLFIASAVFYITQKGRTDNGT